MRRMLTITSATLLLWGGLLLGGCGGSMPGIDLAPAPPRTANWRLPDKLAVAQGNNEELTAVTDSEKARVNYRYRLVVLRDYYRATGSMDKLRWAERELGNLDNAYTFTWEGIPRIEPPPGESLAGADEHVLVEYAVAARREFLAGLDKLLAYYQSAAPNAYKTRRVANVKARFDPVRTYVYFLEAEVPPGDLKPVEVNPAADALYQAAYRDYYYGKGILGFAATFASHTQAGHRLEVDLLDDGGLLLAPEDREGWDVLIGAIHALCGSPKYGATQAEAERMYMRYVEGP